MAPLIVKLLDGSAKVPTVAHPGEDIGYDLYANQDHTLVPGQVHRVQTGVAVAGKLVTESWGQTERLPAIAYRRGNGLSVTSFHSRLLYPRKEAAYMLGISLRSLDHLVANKMIRTQRISKRVLIHEKELQRFARANHYASLTPSKPL